MRGADLLLRLEQETGRTVYELFAACYLSHHMMRPKDYYNENSPKIFCKSALMHAQMCECYRRTHRSIVVAPAKFAKSTWTSFFQPLCDAVLGLVEGRILLISNTGRLAEQWLDMIKKEVEENPDILADYGKLKGRIWRQDHIVLKTGVEIVSFGLNYQVRGTGWAKVIGDDLEDKDMVRSDDQREKFSDWFDTDLLGRMHPDTKLFIIGTMLHPLCKIKNMYDDPDGRYKRWVKHKFAVLDDNGESTWPDRWPTEIIMQQREEMGEKAFLTEKMNEPPFGKDHVFKVEWIRYYDQLPQNLYTVTMTDASSSKKQDVGDYTAITVLGKDLDTGNVYLRTCNRGRWERHSKVKALLDYNHAYHPVFNLLENDAYGKELRDSLLKEAQSRGQYFPYRMIPANKNKIERAQMATDPWEKGQVFLPRKGAQRLIDEHLMFPFGDFDDFVDSMSGALNFLRRQKRRPTATKDIYRPQLKPNAAGRLV